MNRVRIELTKIPEKLSKKGGCRARVLDNGVVDFLSEDCDVLRSLATPVFSSAMSSRSCPARTSEYSTIAIVPLTDFL